VALDDPVKGTAVHETNHSRVYRSNDQRPSSRASWSARLLLPLAALVAACVTVPITGRQAFIPFTVEEDTPLGAEAYAEILSTEQEVTSGPQVKLVNDVMNRLVAASAEFDPGFEWQVKLLKADDVPNAFCLPGGKMAVYTGILPITQDEAGLAVVMGHEIGHALARHGAERMGQQLVQAGIVESVNLVRPDWGQYAEAGLLAADLLVTRPWGRDQELEADHIGLILMARAGYDPRNATSFWQRMSALGGGDTPQWLSTHPSNATRIAQLDARMPEAMAIFEAR
jgi:predicted Zn-dependent protease